MAKITRFPYTPVCPGCHHPDRIDPIAEEGTMAHDKVADEEPAELVRRAAEAAEAHVRGGMRAYFAPIRYGDDYKPMSPFGGEPTRGPEDPRPGAPKPRSGRPFRGGEAELRWWSRTRRGTSPCWWRSNVSAAGSAVCRSRTGRSG